MALAFQNQIQYWSDRLRHGQVGQFFSWWTGELTQVLPASWQKRLQLATRRLVLQLDSASVRMGVEEGNSIRPLDSLTLDEDAGLQRQPVAALLEQNDLGQLPRYLLLDVGQILRKQVSLPIAAESNLQQVLTFEMDRQTPFRAADVYFDWKMQPQQKDSGQIKLDLLVSPRQPIDSAMEKLAARGLAISGVDVIDSGHSLGINMLPPDRRHRVANPVSRLNLALAGACLVLLVVVMVQSLNARADRVAKLEEAIAEVQDEARRVQRLREQLMESGEAASFLVKRRAGTPMTIELVSDVTEILPDDTYLDRLIIDMDSVLMQGKSRNAQQLIEVANKSQMLEDAAFRGSTRLDSATGLEIFEITANITKRGDG